MTPHVEPLDAPERVCGRGAKRDGEGSASSGSFILWRPIRTARTTGALRMIAQTNREPRVAYGPLR